MSLVSDIHLKLEYGEKIAFISDVHVDSKMPDSRVDDIIVTLKDKLVDILNKCVNENVKYVFFEGDVVNRVQCPFEPITMLADILLQFKQKGMQCFSILGNHDIVRNSLENLDKSPIQILFKLGVLEHINLDTRVIFNDNVLLTAVDYTEYPIKADSSYTVNILLAHMFYGKSGFLSDEKHNLIDNNILDLGYDLVVLGHDHEDYEDVVVGSTKIVRHGSVLRGTSHNYNFTRKPNFVIIDDINKPKEVRRIEIAHRDYKDVASEYILNKKTFSSINALQDVLSNLADKLVDTTETDSDRIYNIIMSDEELPNDCRELLLKYINEV